MYELGILVVVVTHLCESARQHRELLAVSPKGLKDIPLLSLCFLSSPYISTKTNQQISVEYECNIRRDRAR